LGSNTPLVLPGLSKNTLPVYFSPLRAGFHEASLCLSVFASHSLDTLYTIKVELSGQADYPQLQVFPSELDFGESSTVSRRQLPLHFTNRHSRMPLCLILNFDVPVVGVMKLIIPSAHTSASFAISLGHCMVILLMPTESLTGFVLRFFHIWMAPCVYIFQCLNGFFFYFSSSFVFI
jgi:hypothetical protein